MRPKGQQVGRRQSIYRAVAIRASVVATALLAVAVPWATMATPVALAANQGSNGVVGVAGRAGKVVLERRGTWRELELANRDADTDIRVNVRSNKVATGLGQSVAIVARRTGDNEYRARVQFTRDGGIMLSAIRRARGTRSIIRARRAGPRGDPSTRLIRCRARSRSG